MKGRGDRQLSPLFTWRTAIASEQSPLTATQRHVALTLSLHMSERGDSCFPGAELLAGETALGVSTVREALKRIREQGWMEVTPRPGQTNLYRACIPLRELEGYAPRDAESWSPSGPPAAGTPPLQHPEGSPPGAGDEDVTEDAKGPRQQQNTEKAQAVASSEPAPIESSLTSAAAVAGEPPSLLQVVEAVGRFRTADINTIRVVEPLALCLPNPIFEEAVERALRRPARNDSGLLVHLLRTAVAERRKIAIEQLVSTIAEPTRIDPEAYVRRLVALPSQATPEQVRAFLARYVTDEAEVDRLVEIAEQLLAESPRKQIERWVREVSPEVVEVAAVHAQIDEWVDELAGADYVERGALHELAEDVRELHAVTAQPAERAA